MSELAWLFIRRLERKRIGPGAMGGFIRNLAAIVSCASRHDLRGINRRLRTLGWDDVNLDDQTYQLFLATVEQGELGALAGGPGARPSEEARGKEAP